MASIEEIEAELVADFEMLADWSEKYEYIIDLGTTLPPIDVAYKIEENKVKGCQSSIWISAKGESGRLQLFGESDALIVQGLVALVFKLYNGRPYQEVIEDDLTLFSALGLEKNLSPTRSNGLHSMVKQVKMYAMAFAAREEQASNN